MRTLELLQALNQKEVKIIEWEVVAGKRKSLLLLFKTLKRWRKRNVIPPRSELFGKIYGRKYSQDKDYLLRNELRLLNDIIYNYLLFSRFKVELAENRSLYYNWLSKAFYHRKMKFFGEDIDQFIKYARREMQTEILSQMYSAKISWSSSSASTADFNKIMAEIKEWQYEEKRRFLHRYRKTEYSTAYFEALAKDFNVQQPLHKTKNAIQFNFAEIAENDWYTRYLVLQKNIVESEPPEVIAYLEEMVSLLNTEAARRIIKKEQRIIMLAHLADSLFKTGDYDQAELRMAEVMMGCENAELAMASINVYNYIKMLFYNYKYKEAVSIYNKHYQLLAASNQLVRGSVLAAYCYLFLKMPDKALEILPPLTGLNPEEMLDVRYVYLIAFTIREHFDLALTEAHNLKRVILKLEQPAGSKTVLEHFAIVHAYIRALSKSKTEKERQLNLLGKKLELNHKTYEQMAGKSPQLLWVMRRLQG